MTRVVVIGVSYGIGRPILVGLNSVAVMNDWAVTRIDPVPGYVQPAIREYQPDAVVIVNEGHLYELVPRSVPVVVINSDVPAAGAAGIRVDESSVGIEAGRHLLAQGLRSFSAYGSAEDRWAVARVRAFRKTVEEGGGRFVEGTSDRHMAQPADSDRWTDWHAEWLRMLPKPVGVFCPCDNWARMLVFFAQIHPARVPEQIAILGADNDVFECETGHPPLSSVPIPWEKAGVGAGRIIERAVRGEDVRNEKVTLSAGPVIIRQSTDAMSVVDGDVQTALKYIQAHATGLITVPTIVRQVPAARRTLERTFRQLVGRTMVEEIRRVRVERAKRLLVMTDLPVAEIATRVGYRTPSRLSIAFRKETTTTPLAFRREFHLRT